MDSVNLCAFVLAHKCATRTKRWKTGSVRSGRVRPLGTAQSVCKHPCAGCYATDCGRPPPWCCASVCASLMARWLRHRVLTHECRPPFGGVAGSQGFRTNVVSVSHNLSAGPPAPLVIIVIKSPSIRVARERSFGPSNHQPNE